MKIVDLTRPLEARMPVYPGDPPVEFAPHADLAADGYRVARVEFGTHTGTHLDAPAHFLSEGAGVDALPLAQLVGPATVLPPPDGGETYSFAAGDRLLVASGWSERWGDPDYFEVFPGLPETFIQALEVAPVALIGLETPSLHPDHEIDADYHRRLLGAGIVIVENLMGLRGLPPQVEFVALPLPLRDLDGAPCRAIARIDA